MGGLIKKASIFLGLLGLISHFMILFAMNTVQKDNTTTLITFIISAASIGLQVLLVYGVGEIVECLTEIRTKSNNHLEKKVEDVGMTPDSKES